MAGDLTKIAEESAHTSLELWQSWLRLRPSRWDPEKRKLLSEYVSLLQMIAGGDGYDEGVGRRVFRRYYTLFPKVATHFALLGGNLPLGPRRVFRSRRDSSTY